MRAKERYEKALAWFEANMPVAESELHFENEYQLLVAVMLSAQCTDKRVNMVTPALFKAYPTIEDLADSTAENVPVHMHVGYRHKYRNLQHLALDMLLLVDYLGT